MFQLGSHHYYRQQILLWWSQDDPRKFATVVPRPKPTTSKILVMQLRPFIIKSLALKLTQLASIRHLCSTLVARNDPFRFAYKPKVCIVGEVASFY